jgi:hypothetical protein
MDNVQKSVINIYLLGTCKSYLCFHCNKVKVNLSLCLVKHYAMKTYGGVEV